MIKGIGVLMTLAACGTMGFTWADIYEKRAAQLVALDAALQLLETEILYGATPLEDAMLRISQACDRDVAELFKQTSAELGKKEGVTAGEAWSNALKVLKLHSALKDTDLQILKRLGASLGVSDREDQAKHLELTRSQLKLAAIQAGEISRKNSALFKYMGILGGLFLVLVLY